MHSTSTYSSKRQRNTDGHTIIHTRRLLVCLVLISLLIIQPSCKKLAEVAIPSNTINSGNVYASDATAIAAVTNIYANMSRGNLPGGGITSLSLFPALSADELSLFGGATNNSVYYYYTNALSGTNLNTPDFWTTFYTTIFAANAAIEGLAVATSLTPSVKQQLTGEVKFIRAFCYFYLVNLYGDVPLAVSTDYKINSRLARSPRADVYQQIISDLTNAQNLLNAGYLDATLLHTSSERVRPTKGASTALLARAYLYTRDWANAEAQSTLVIGNNALYEIVSINNVFLKNSKEAIWQLQPVNAGWNTEDARTFIIPASGPDAYNHPFYVSSFLNSAFETGDQRKTNWTGTVTINGNTYCYPFKYKNAMFNDPVTEYQTVLRLGEQYLIRAEARAQQNNVAGAQADLNIIRKRAGLPNTSANDSTSLQVAILKERRAELFIEWGHRWLDLKRTGNIDAVMNVITPQKGGTWSINWQWYPISTTELLLNNNLVQNAGY